MAKGFTRSGVVKHAALEAHASLVFALAHKKNNKKIISDA